MPGDYFAVLGLSPGRYGPAVITRRFHAARERLLAELADPATRMHACQALESLHIAYAALRDPHRQAEYLRSRGGEDSVRALQRLIRASLEDGLLRYSRRQQILAAGRRLGFSDFHIHLLIAQCQFGDDDLIETRTRPRSAARGVVAERGWAGAAAVGVLALAIFLALVSWLGH